jgi:hypothetical protein
MTNLVYEKLLNCEDKKIKLVINSFQGESIYYGYVKGLDNDYVLLQLDNSTKEIVIRLKIINEVFIYEN